MGHVVLAIPYTILILVPRLERLDMRLEEAARDLGAGAFQTFRLITFPLLLPALVSAYIVAFVLSFDEIVVASFIAGDTTTFPLYLFSQLRFPTLLPQVIAVACIVMAALGAPADRRGDRPPSRRAAARHRPGRAARRPRVSDCGRAGRRARSSRAPAR